MKRNLKSGEIEVKIDFMGKPFIVDACDTDGDRDGKRLSTKNFLWEEISNIGREDTLYGTRFVNGIYRVSTTGEWNYEHTEYDYDINYKLIEKL